MAVCSVCAVENPDGQRFCGSCAAPLLASEQPEHRKTVTLVFCDLVGSTAFGESADPETVKRLRGLANRLLLAAAWQPGPYEAGLPPSTEGLLRNR